MFIAVNYLAILVCGILNMVIGTLWYSRFMFGTKWLKLSGANTKATKQEKMAMNQKAMKAMLFQFVSALLSAYALSVLLNFSIAVTVYQGLRMAFLVWIGFYAFSDLAMMYFNHKSFEQYLIDESFKFLNLMIFGALLAVWY